MDNINTKMDFKTRNSNAQGRQKKKYFRQPKIYQNNYINDLHDRGLVIEDYEELEPIDGHNILYLFFKEQD